MRAKGLLLAAASVLSAFSTNAYAQSSDASASEEESFDILVIAQKREERLVDVPIAITAVSGDQLVRQGVFSPSDLGKIVPSFTFQTSPFGSPVFAIRGVGFYENSLGASPTVSVYLDEVPLPYSVMARGVSIDLARVEALKGPQGTLFGQNATGGAINYISASPTDDLSAGFDLDYGRFNALNAQAFLSTGLAPNLRLRVAARHESQDAWQQSYAPNDVIAGKPVGDELGARDFSTGRVALDWDATEDLTLKLTASGWTDHSDPIAGRYRAFSPASALNPFTAPVYNLFAQFQPIPRGNARLAGWNRNPERDDWFYQIALRGDLELGGGTTLHSISAYSRFDQNYEIDADGTPTTAFSTRRRGDIENFYQELRVDGAIDRLKWLVGANYAWDRVDENPTNFLGGTNAGVGPFRYSSVRQLTTQVSDTWAVFGSLEYELSDSLSAQISARYNNQKRHFSGCLADTGVGDFSFAFNNIFGIASVPGGCVTMASPPPAAPLLLDSVESDLNQDNISWRGILSWKPTNDSLLYASVSEGYKAGSYPVLPGVFAFQFDPVTQESVLSYEVGFKFTGLDRRVQLSGAAFYYDYTDKQILATQQILPFGYLPKLVNIPKSRAYGMELELQARPFEGLRMSIGATYMNSRVQQNPSSAVTLDLFGQPTSFLGEAFPNTPRWQGVADIEYGFDAGGVRPFIGGSAKARSSSHSVFGLNQESLLEGYTLVDLRAGVESADGSWRAQVWGRNVFNTFHLLTASYSLDAIEEFAGMPATYGISISYRY
jgi:iron complex outermembrane recepter protein